MEKEITRTTIYLKEKSRKQLEKLCKLLDETKSSVIRKAIKMLSESIETNKKVQS